MIRSMGPLALALSLVYAGCGDDASPTGPDGSTGSRDSGTGPGAGRCTLDDDCNDGIYCNGTEVCMPGIAGVDGRGCAPGIPPCMTGQTCSEENDRCATECEASPDADGDGSAAPECGGDDCDDTDPDRFPGNTELCDLAGHDEDCDPATFGTRDADNDGFVDARCCNGEACGDDCNDGRPDVSPMAAEACNLVDDDCDGMVDENVRTDGYVDADGDLHGDPDSPMSACLGQAGFVLVADDCDDTDPRRHAAQIEVCDGIDNDCNDLVDDTTTAVLWYGDADGDGFGSPETGTVLSCDPVPGYSLLSTDCDDGRAGVNPAADEACDGRDNDCNGVADFQIGEGNLEDDDGDGFADIDCGPFGTDCDDQDSATFTGAREICDGRDNNCDGLSDDGTDATLWYLDFDRDGFGDAREQPVSSCEPPPGHVLRVGDCDDTDPTRGPGQFDDCDGRDDDCDDVLDENAQLTAYFPDLDFDGFGDDDAQMNLCLDVPEDLLTIGGDCDDTNANINEGSVESCNGLDDDCDGRIDEGFRARTCGEGTCARTVAVCDDGVPTACIPGTPQPEICNSFDDDCDGVIDNLPAAANNCGDPSSTAFACTDGACQVVACLGQNDDCNNFAGDGCEADLTSDPLNCGSCGEACRAGDTCLNGACQSTPIEISADENHTCVRLGDTSMWCWGQNTAGQLGRGDTSAALGAQQVMMDVSTPLTGVISIDAGHTHTCAVISDGRALAWGTETANRGYISGAGSTVDTPYLTPNEVDPVNAVNIACGYQQTCVVLNTGEQHCQGSLSYNPGNCNTSAPVCNRINPVLGINRGWLGWTSGFARTGSGQLYAFGDNAGNDADGTLFGRLGINRDDTNTTATRIWQQLCRDGSNAQFPTDPRDVAVGGRHACVILADTTVACAGDIEAAGLGMTPPADRNIFQPVAGLSGAVDIDAGAGHTCAVLDDGSLHCWGRNSNGQLLADTAGEPALGPIAVPSLPFGARAVACGRRHTCALLDDNRVYCWGGNDVGQLGQSDTMPRVGIHAVSGLP